MKAARYPGPNVLRTLCGAACVLLALPSAAATTTVTFDSLTPGDIFTEEVVGDYVVSGRLPNGVHVHPNAPVCEGVSCTETSTPSLALPPGNGRAYAMWIERIDGQPFEPVSVAIAHSGDSASCGYRYLYDTGALGAVTYLRCRAGDLQTFELAPLEPAGPRIVRLIFIESWSAAYEGPIQIDDLVVREAPPPPAPGLFELIADRRATSALGSPPIYDEWSNRIGCGPVQSETDRPATAFAKFSDQTHVSYGWASQKSSFDATGFMATGVGSGWSDYCWGDGQSAFDIDFALTGPAYVRLFGWIDTAEYSWGSEASVLLQRDGEEILSAVVQSDGSIDGPSRFEIDEVLPPGTYTITSLAEGSLGDASFAVEARVADAPPIDVEVLMWPPHPPRRASAHGRGLVSVTLLGSEALDVASIDPATLAFGPAGAEPVDDRARGLVRHVANRDLNDDGLIDLVTLYRSGDTGIEAGDPEACLTGETREGRRFEGCAQIVARPYCGRGYELTAVVLPWAWLRRRSRLGR